MKVLSLTSQPGEPRYCQSLQVNYWFWERGYEVLQFAVWPQYTPVESVGFELSV
jgi:hypothetical protein